MTPPTPSTTERVLVVAKAPVPGRAKTRLGAEVGDHRAAALAAASLLDVLEAATSTVGAQGCHLALDGDLADGVRSEELRDALAGWTVRRQGEGDLGRRLADAHAGLGPGPVVQVGMDTPQLTAGLLHEVLAGLDDHDAVLGPATDGGWWALALRDPARAAVLGEVPMSTPTTYADTRAALEATGLRVTGAPGLTDVDTAEDAGEVAAAAPASRFAREWTRRTDREAAR
jgi:rSAM/selenodomain-associated transferase 1